MRNDLLHDHCARRDMMCPPQSIEVACETFLPQTPHSFWFKTVKPTVYGGIAFLKAILTSLPGSEKIHGRGEMFNGAHPAFSSSETGFDESLSGLGSVESRPGDRFPGRSCFLDTGDGSSAFTFDCGALCDPRSPKSVRSRSSAPSDSASSASLSSAFRKANSTRVSAGAVLRKCVSVTVLACSVNARFSARFKCIFSHPIQPILRAYKNSQ